jgi:polyhydroxyalkanoate synthesis regulator phasin
VNVVDFLKKSVAFGVGAAAFSAEKMKQFADEMVAKGELTSEEASKFVEEVSQKAEQEKKSLQDWMRDQMSKMLQQMGAAEAAKVSDLERRIATIEAHLGTGGEEPEGASTSAEEPLPPASA